MNEVELTNMLKAEYDRGRQDALADVAASVNGLLDSVPNLEVHATGKEGDYMAFGEVSYFPAFATVYVYRSDDRSPDAKFDVYEGEGDDRWSALVAAVQMAAEGRG